jgi:hypothetical protein
VSEQNCSLLHTHNQSANLTNLNLRPADLLARSLAFTVRLVQMARGWESKSVEQQQEEMPGRHSIARPPISPEQQRVNRKRDGLLLSRQRLTQQLQTACNPQHRQMLEQSIAEMDSQLSFYQQVADQTTPK